MPELHTPRGGNYPATSVVKFCGYRELDITQRAEGDMTDDQLIDETAAAIAEDLFRGGATTRS